ncbi:MAG: prolipoprotein diacylglyceryl transferase [Bryobacteraceae bacterium]|nr:prolipoprotein diacylglyceryl transferase [Bryobacteraceae bacterium]
MHPKLITIGDFFLPTYGVLVATAFLAALWIASRLARKSGLNPDQVTNLGAYCALSGLVGAKLLMILLDFDYYRRNPGEIFSLSTLQAGGVFYGGLVIALLVAWLYMRRQGLPAARTADVFAPGLALGHAIGRLGCFAAGCCWGVACERPWAVTFTDPEAHRLVGVPLNTPLHPTQLYEAAAELATFGVVYYRFRKPHRDGSIVGLYLILYSVARFAVEFLRFHDQPNPFGGPFSATQWISLALLAVGLFLTLRKNTAAPMASRTLPEAAPAPKPVSHRK